MSGCAHWPRHVGSRARSPWPMVLRVEQMALLRAVQQPPAHCPGPETHRGCHHRWAEDPSPKPLPSAGGFLAIVSPTPSFLPAAWPWTSQTLAGPVSPLPVGVGDPGSKGHGCSGAQGADQRTYLPAVVGDPGVVVDAARSSGVLTG